MPVGARCDNKVRNEHFEPGAALSAWLNLSRMEIGEHGTMEIHPGQNWTMRVVDGLADIPAREWDACANPESTGNSPPLPFDPFISHAFLQALEESGSAMADTGWVPRHLLLENADGELLGAVPMYFKSHSRGEYVFDYQWADALEQAGGSYYPKLQVSVPFTPVTGRRLLIRPGNDDRQIESLLMDGCLQVARQSDLSSLHLTFLEKELWERLGKAGLLLRTDQQFRWQNREYADFDEFLAQLSSKKRRNIKQERRTALTGGIQIEQLTGSSIKEHHWDAFFQFYLDTGSRKWGTPYLTRSFFSLVGAAMADRILLIMCRLGDKYVAGALNFIGGDCLYGRYWGALDDFPCLHFEVCYYQAIEYAIRQKLSFVDAGAQGEHKLARGYLPRQTFSAHWVANEGFRSAIAEFLLSERRYVSENMEVWEGHSPFRSSDK